MPQLLVVYALANVSLARWTPIFTVHVVCLSSRRLPLMGWTSCFPNRASLQRLAAASRRSSYETEDRTEHSVPDGDRRRHRQGGFSHCRVWRRREDCLPEEDQAIGSQRRVREAATVHRRHGSLLERSL